MIFELFSDRLAAQKIMAYETICTTCEVELLLKYKGLIDRLNTCIIEAPIIATQPIASHKKFIFLVVQYFNKTIN